MFCENKHLAHVLDSELINPATRPHWGNLTQANCVFIIVAVTQAPCPCLVCLCVSDASSQPESQHKFLFCFSSAESKHLVLFFSCPRDAFSQHLTFQKERGQRTKCSNQNTKISGTFDPFVAFCEILSQRSSSTAIFIGRFGGFTWCSQKLAGFGTGSKSFHCQPLAGRS